MEKFLGISLGDGPLEILFLILVVMIGVAIGLLWPLGEKKEKRNDTLNIGPDLCEDAGMGIVYRDMVALVDCQKNKGRRKQARKTLLALAYRLRA